MGPMMSDEPARTKTGSSEEAGSFLAKIATWLKSVQGIVTTFVAICLALGGLVTGSCKIRMFAPAAVCQVLAPVEGEIKETDVASVKNTGMPAATRERNNKQELTYAMRPRATILSPNDGSHFSDGWVEIRYALRSPPDHPIDRVELKVGKTDLQTGELEETASGEFQGRAEVLMQHKSMIVFLAAQSGDMVSDAVNVELIYDPNALAGRGKDVPAYSAPTVSIISPIDQTHFRGDSAEISYSLQSPSGLPIDRLDVQVDGQPQEFERTSSSENQGIVVVKLPHKDSVLSIVAHSGNLTSSPASMKFVYDPNAITNMYALLVGVTDYDNDYTEIKDYTGTQFATGVNFAARDAEGLAKALEAQSQKLYDVHTKVVIDATKQNLTEGFEWLREKVKDGDLAIVFLSGYGFLDAKRDFWFLTRDADLSQLGSTAISKNDLHDLMGSVPGKKVLLIDTCRANAAFAPAARPIQVTLGRDMSKSINNSSTEGSGFVGFAATQWNECKLEDAKSRHSAFAKALIEAIGEGKAALDPSGRVTTDMLDLYVEDHVKAMTSGQQHPIMNRPNLIPDFPVALAQH